MCLYQRQIINPSKYVSLKYRDPFLMSVGCGHCAECQQTLSNQWYFRTWVECQDVGSNGFVYFDSLSYDSRYLPRLNEVVPDFPGYSCFRASDVRNFLEALRLDCKRNYNVNFRYFFSTEYGYDNLYRDHRGRLRRGTNRPHYHLLFFIHDEIDPFLFSSLVAKHWKFGITDGAPYKSAAYVLEHNTIKGNSLPVQFLRACRYVTKYVQKSCFYDEKIEKRINAAMFSIAEKMSEDPDKWLESPAAIRIRRRIKSRVSQFHRQSKQFGASYLAEIDLDEVFKTGVLYMPSPKGLKIPIVLPMYYKRKLFYDMVVVDGCKTWKLNRLGIDYRKARSEKLVNDLSDKLYSACLTYNIGYSIEDCRDLADYIYNSRGRIRADAPSEDFEEKLKHVDYFNYATLSDKEHLNHRGIVNRFLGNNSIGYNVDDLPPSYSFKQFIAKYVILDDEKEKKIDHIFYCLSQINDEMQDGFKLRQRLENLYKSIRSFSLQL